MNVKPDGTFTYPRDLVLPPRPAVLESDDSRADFQKRTLQILLDGRNEADLMKQIRTGYSHLGIRL
ncbi:MAG: hypothetical protein WDN28_27975 [Chthoniobacter sp.]